MRALVRALGPVGLGVGGALLAESLATGAARISLLGVVPVISGTTPLFGLSVGFLVAGFFFLPLLFAGGDLPEAPTTGTAPPDPVPGSAEGGSGGVILLGPIPIFFGAWRRNPPISYRWAVFLGVALAFVAGLWLWGPSVR
ncbi:MAG: DUF131 domain-containing protein [Thermoplasmata archaeon]